MKSLSKFTSEQLDSIGMGPVTFPEITQNGRYDSGKIGSGDLVTVPKDKNVKKTSEEKLEHFVLAFFFCFNQFQHNDTYLNT